MNIPNEVLSVITLLKSPTIYIYIIFQITLSMFNTHPDFPLIMTRLIELASLSFHTRELIYTEMSCLRTTQYFHKYFLKAF